MCERRLPIYLLVDVSASMDGEPIQAVGTIIQRLLADLRADPCTLETAWISVITFGDIAKQVVPLTPLDEFRIPKFTIGGGAAFGPALSLLCESREFEVVKATAERKGDWRPIVFSFVNGQNAVGDLDKGINDFKSQKWGKYVFIASGRDVNMAYLKRINAEAIIKLDSIQVGTLAKYFGWGPRFGSMCTCSKHFDSEVFAGNGFESQTALLVGQPPLFEGMSMADEKALEGNDQIHN